MSKYDLISQQPSAFNFDWSTENRHHLAGMETKIPEYRDFVLFEETNLELTSYSERNWFPDLDTDLQTTTVSNSKPSALNTFLLYGGYYENMVSANTHYERVYKRQKADSSDTDLEYPNINTVNKELKQLKYTLYLKQMNL